ncbi:MAG: tetratricopeptide repeat protein [Acidobacteria bacterium]|nr:tetratricopeptide repeat protein [Acidobacteriota bacterium]
MPRASAVSSIAALALAASAVYAASQQERLAQARELARAGKPAEAAAIYQELYDAAPADLALRFQLAVARQMAGEFDAASEHSRAVAEQRPDFPPAWLFLGAALLRGGHAHEATAPLRRAITLGVADPSAPLMLGEALLQTGEPREAAAQFVTAAKALPGNPRVWYGLERASAALANTSSPDATSCSPGDLDCALREARFADLASQSLARLRALPPSSQAYELEARSLDARGMSREAAEQWRQALALEPESTSLKLGLASALRLARDCERALPLLEQLPESAQTLFFQGDCLLSIEKAQDAVNPLRRAIELDPSLLGASGRLGAAYVKLGEPEQAIAPLERALASDPDGAFHYLLARAYRALGQDDKARAVLADRKATEAPAR